VNNEPPFSEEQKRTLKKVRLRWLIALLTNAPLPFITLPLTGSAWLEQAPPQEAKQAMLVAALLGAAAIIGGLYSRNQAYKAYWRGDVVEPAGYLRGNTLFFVAVNAGAAAMFVISLINAYPAPTFFAAPIFVGLLVFNFPGGKPMLPAPPRIGIDRDGDSR